MSDVNNRLNEVLSNAKNSSQASNFDTKTNYCYKNGEVPEGVGSPSLGADMTLFADSNNPVSGKDSKKSTRLEKVNNKFGANTADANGINSGHMMIIKTGEASYNIRPQPAVPRAGKQSKNIFSPKNQQLG